MYNKEKLHYWRPNLSIGCAVLCFYPKTGFLPSYCQISTDLIKFCTQLLLYGTHLWADLDRDRRVGGSRPNQNDYVFVILVTHVSPIYRRQIAVISVAKRQSGWEDRCYREKFRNFVAWAESDPKTAFFAFLWYPSTILRTVYRKQFYPQTMVLMESRNSEGVPFAGLESLWPGTWQT